MQLDWKHFNILEIFGDYVLSSVEGNILEIGVGVSSLHLSNLAKKYNRIIYHCDISHSAIQKLLEVKDFLIPKQTVLYPSSSDSFFLNVNIQPIAFAFIDGNHDYEQVKKDFNNVIPYIVNDGYILLHDTYPPNKRFTELDLCGTVYKLRKEIEQDKRFDCLTLTKQVALGVGLTIIRKKGTNEYIG